MFILDTITTIIIITVIIITMEQLLVRTFSDKKEMCSHDNVSLRTDEYLFTSRGYDILYGFVCVSFCFVDVHFR
jgi:C4-dicarboxylate transporter